MEKTKFNPTNHSYAFRLKGSCYALKSGGVCSLNLTSEEVKLEYEKERTDKQNIYKEESVLYCRELAEFLIEIDYYNDASKDPFPITIHQNYCGHFTFSDGQHRTCIAKHLTIDSIEVEYHDNENFKCAVCSKRERETWFQKMNVFKKKELPRTIIDDEYLYKDKANFY